MNAVRMHFGEALVTLRHGFSVRRLGWNGKGQRLRLQRPGPASKMTLPYIFIHTQSQDCIPWVASQTDLLADDWVMVDLPAEAVA